MIDVPEMLTVEQTKARSGLAACHIRRLVADESIIAIRAGRKILINFNSVIAYLETGIPQGKPSTDNRFDSETAPHIMPIPLK